MDFNNSYRPQGFGGIPVVTKNIIIINVIMYLATLALATKGIDLYKYLSLHYYLASDFRPHQFITYIFMHETVDQAGHLVLSHLAFNMLGVFVFGQVLEQYWGPKRFLIFYIITGLGAALAQYLVMYFKISHTLDLVNIDLASSYISSADKEELLRRKEIFLNHNQIAGASGSLFGLLGAFGLLFPNREIYIYFFPIKAKWLVIGYGAMELFSGWRNNPMDNVAHFAHLGGLFVGLILVLIWRKDRAHFY